LLAVGALIGAGVVLVTSLQSTTTSYTRLNSQNNAIAIMRSVQNAENAIVNEPEFTLSVDPATPGDQFAVALDVVAPATFRSGGSNSNRDALHPGLTLTSQLYEIQTRGTAPAQTILTFDLASNSGNMDRMDIYGWYAEEAQWRFMPSSHSNDQIIVRTDAVPDRVGVFQAALVDPIIVTQLDFNQSIQAANAQIIDVLKPVGMQPALPNTPQRTLIGNLAGGFELNTGYDTMPILRNYADLRAIDAQTVQAIISDDALRDEHISQISSLVAAGNFDGVFIDYRNLTTADQAAFSAFMHMLGTELRRNNAKLGVLLPAPQNVDGQWDTQGYDWASIGQAVDYLQVDLTIDPTSFTPGADRYVEALFRWATSQVQRYKIIGGISARSIQETNGEFTPISYDAALAPLGDVVIAEGSTLTPGSEITLTLDGFDALPGEDTLINAPFIDYFNTDGSLATRMWLTTARALHFRLDRLTPFSIGGAALPDLLTDELADGLLIAVQDYKNRRAVEDDTDDNTLQLQWRVLDEKDNSLIREFTTGFNDVIRLTLQDIEGDYTVQVNITNGRTSRPRDGVAIALYQPTITPTPVPTGTPRPTATPTPTLIPVVPTINPAGNAPIGMTPIGGGNNVNFGTGPIAPPVGGGIDLTGFEYGGHVTNAGSTRAAEAMRSAGMTWMKVQIRYGPGETTDVAQSNIQSARSQGFKILLGVVGSPNDMRAGGDAFIDGFVNWLGAVAALGPDAIEVWNEPNLGREWPSGQINGASYANLLARSYNAIKSANPNVIVISGAPAPTGAQDAFPGNVVNDDVYLTQMMSAGFLDYTDCVGVHYNEGLVTGSARSGDPRGDDYYTRYLPRLLERYTEITGGRKPFCITELGYLTADGYGPLPNAFAWARGMSVRQQAAFLADAAAFTSRSGRVRLMIVWNIDFTNYDANDPMAGYAIIRPGGGCPACAALAAASR